MRHVQRYTVHRRLLLTFLLLGCAGSFVLGQEMARAFAAIPVYAAQSLTFSGAGITASLVTPLQATGSIGQPTPQPKVVKQHDKPTNKPKGNGPTTLPVTPPQPAPVKSPPIVLQGPPIGVPPTTNPCATASCAPGVKPEPPVIPPPSPLSTGITGSAPTTAPLSETPAQQCAPLGLVSRPATSLPGAAPAQCPFTTTTPADGAAPTDTPKPVSTPGVIETPLVISAPQVALPAPVVHPVVPAVTTTSPLIPTSAPAEATSLSPATCDLASAPVTTFTDPLGQDAAVVSVAVVMCQQQPPA